MMHQFLSCCFQDFRCLLTVLLWCLLGLWMCKLTFFIKFLNFWTIISSNTFLCLILSSSGTPIKCIVCVQWCSTGIWGSVHFSSFFFSFCSSDWIISIAVSSSLLILYSSSSKMLLNLSSEFLISVISLFNSRISIRFSLSLCVYIIYIYIIYIIHIYV